ncbi:MAG: hydroxyacid dehydrogenase [Streptococcaceae bacterium]|jgi:phosphoglycerate dehydrogenase-like enzyme|nr:hydroxyacid dehydrogenase [Streptococcaceae bacterium]
MKIAIINSSSFGQNFPEHIEQLEQYGTVERFNVPTHLPAKELAEVLADHEIIISSVTPFFTREFFELKQNTKLISRHGIGYNNIDMEAATEYGVPVTIVSPEVENDAVAENAVAILLANMRKVLPAEQATKSSNWALRNTFLGRQVREKTVGIIGFGNIGSRVGEIMYGGFKVRLLIYDPYVTPERLALPGVEQVELDYLLANSDVISLNAKITHETKYMISDREFDLMKDGVYIVNTARGELFDEDALIRALDSGKLAGVSMDVVENEPIDGTHRLLTYENVIITPHTSAYTSECLYEMGNKCVSDVIHLLSKKPLKVQVNPEVKVAY